MPTRSRLRLAGAALSVFALVALGASLARAWNESTLQRWDELGLTWLFLESWSRDPAFVPGLAAAGGFLTLALAAGFLPPYALLPRLGRGTTAFLAHSWVGPPLLLAWAFLPGLCVWRLRPEPPERAPNVLFVLVDTWRADHAGFLGYERDVSPKLDRLVERGVVFERAKAQSSWTMPSVATLLTGLMPSKHRAISQPLPDLATRGSRLSPPVTTLIEVLAARGWDTAMWSSNPNITPPRGFAQGAGYFKDYFHDPARTDDSGRIDRILADVRRWFAEEHDPARPFCAYVHVMDAHYPYDPPPPFRGAFERSSAFDRELTGPLIREYMLGDQAWSELSPDEVRHWIDRYDEELLAVDHFVGDFIAEILAEHPDTLIVISGDHGEEFMEHGRLGHSHSLYEEIVHVPLVFWAPQLAPGRIATQVRLMDVFPTLLELCGLSDALPPEVQGESLVPVIGGRETADRPAPMESGGDEKPVWQWRGLCDGRTKLIRREADVAVREPVPPLWDGEERAQKPRSLLFDLGADPRETRDLHAERPGDADALFELLRARGWYVPPAEILRFRPAPSVLRPEDAHDLDALGYGGESAPAGKP